jgi:hypothetical protein
LARHQRLPHHAAGGGLRDHSTTFGALPFGFRDLQRADGATPRGVPETATGERGFESCADALLCRSSTDQSCERKE